MSLWLCAQRSAIYCKRKVMGWIGIGLHGMGMGMGACYNCWSASSVDQQSKRGPNSLAAREGQG